MNQRNPIKLSVIVPVFNEKNTVLQVLDKVRKVNIPKEIVVVDNCSTDGTRELLKQAAGIDRLILQPKNMGKGSSIRTAIPYLRGEFAVIQDGDLEYDPESYVELISMAEKNQCDAVYGSRIMGGRKAHYASYYFGVQFLTMVTNLLFHSDLTDVATTYKLVRTSVIKTLKLRCSGFDLDFELTNQICKHGYKIMEVPVSYNPRTFLEGKKIRSVDGLRALFVIAKNYLMD